MNLRYLINRVNHLYVIYVFKKKNKTISFSNDFPLYQTELSEYIHIEPDFRILGKGKVKIGSNVVIARGFRGITTMHQSEIGNNDMLPYNGANDKVSEIIIKDNVWIGSSVTVLAGITIHEGAVIGAGSVVTKDVQKGHIIAGVPAKTIKTRDMEHYEKLKADGDLYLPQKFKKTGHV